MTIGTLQAIIKKIRILTGSGNNFQLMDSEIIDYINSYYLYDMPTELRILKLKDVYTFNTIQGIEVYPFNFDGWETVNSPAYIDKEQVAFFQDKKSFSNYSDDFQEIENFDLGDGSMGAFSGNTLSFPIRRSYYNNPITNTQTAPTSVQSPSTYPPSFGDQNMSRVQNILISANTATSTLNVTDDGAGNLIGDCTAGTIDYFTGAISGLTFTGVIPSGNNISIHYIPANLSRPWAILFYQNQFVLDNVPDQGYQVEIEGIRKPSQALLGSGAATNLSGRPEMIGWWELLAYGASKKIYQERLDVEGVQLMDTFLQEQIQNARTRTYAQLGSRQIPTMFRDATNQLNFEG